ncbi:MAG: tyrosine-type recombinase/integrase [Acidithiobacillus sp.]
MNNTIDLQAKINDYLAERRSMGFKLVNMGAALANFARFSVNRSHQGPLTTTLMADWARHDTIAILSLGTQARRLAILRPFTQCLRQFEALTEIPDESVFGPIPGRVAPHIYHDYEIVELLTAARGLDVQNGLRAATYETLFGLIASAGLRISEALKLLDSDVDLHAGTLTVRLSKFAKTRLLPLHPSTVDALARYRRIRAREISTTEETTFFVGTRAKRLGQPLSDRQVHRVFIQLRDQLGWLDRGCHGGPRIHDLRHSFAVRQVMLWHEQGINIDQAMLSLSTYLGHARITDTYWYLTGVPELMALAGAKFMQFTEMEMEVDDA